VNAATASFAIATPGSTVIQFFAEDHQGKVETAKTLTVRIDRSAPVASCDAPSGAWSATNVSVHCTAADETAGSGLASAGDSLFSLTTAVPQGTEAANAQTGSRQVCDVASNCVKAGPIGGNKVDRKPPAITISSPANTTYTPGQVVAANFSCTDGGSGVSTCSGTVSSGSNIDTSTPGQKSFTVSATHAVGNAAQLQVSYTVASVYNICLDDKPTDATPAGGVATIRIHVCDVNEANAGGAGITVTAVSVNPTGTIESPGANNPGGVFKYLNEGGYQFLLSTRGYAPGAYALLVKVGSDPTVHPVPFVLK